jgi:phenylacetyl-CoA:acceptor oxidoreductase subunit 2
MWFESGAALVVAAVLGLAFLFCQAMMFFAAKGIPAWRARGIVPLILITGLAEGGGLFVCLAVLSAPLNVAADPAAAAVAILTALRTIAWRRYLDELKRDGAPTRTLEALAQYRLWFIPLGLMIPVLLIAFGFLVPRFAAALFVVAGVLVFATGWALKYIIIRGAGYNQGFALTHTPVRGAGLAGPGVKPGWTTT